MLIREPDLSILNSSQRAVCSVSFLWICDRNDADFEATLDRYIEAMQTEMLPWSLVVINNGLGDQVTHRISAKLSKESIDSTIINFSVQSPQSTALSVALKQSTGDAVVVLPAYPQADPRDISRMMDAMHNGLDYVASWRTPRVDSIGSQQKSKLFNAITRWCTGIEIHDINSGLRAMRREVIENLPLYGDLHISLPILASRQGYKVGEVPVRHLEERESLGGHGISVYPRRALDLLTLFFLMRFTQKPFRFFGGIGTGLLATGGLINLMLAAQKLFFHGTLADRPMLVLATLLMVLGIQMFSLGLIGELIIFVNAGGVKDYEIEHVYESNSDRDYS
jgi:glycosyltransferase involved in cell wall biosynthesis